MFTTFPKGGAGKYTEKVLYLNYQRPSEEVLYRLLSLGRWAYGGGELSPLYDCLLVEVVDTYPVVRVRLVAVLDGS